MPENDEEFLKLLREAFGVESAEHLQAMSAALLALEGAPPGERQREFTETVFREAHSLKGAARSVDRGDIESICQVLESVFQSWKKCGVPAAAGIFDTLSETLDFIKELLVKPQPAGRQASALIQRLRALENDAASGVLPVPEPSAGGESEPLPAPIVVGETIRIATAKMDALLLQAEEMIAVKNTADEQAGELRTIGRMMESWNKEWAKASPELQRLRTAMERSQSTSSRLFDFLEWNHSYLRSIEERVAALAKNAEKDRRMAKDMVDNLLNDAKRLVMLPLATLLDAFPRQVRDLARDQDKQVELVLQGREIEIDKRILEQMKDPLMHLIRNAVDHGLEKPAVRAGQHKTERGVLSIVVSQVDASKVEIVVSDDGAGIDLAAVRAAARKAGKAEAATESERDALELIFQSGISTNTMITEISGRGLGMAIVREKVEKLGGNVEVESQFGRGTRFRIVLPVTLATFKGLLVSAGGQEFILPITNVERVLRVAPEEIKTVENREMISWESRALSLVRLATVLGLTEREGHEETRYLQTVILSAGETKIAFVVEEVRHEQEVLIKPLQKPLVAVRNIAAATVLGSGRAILILNVPDLLQSAARSGAGAAIPAALSETKAKTILVTDDSMTSRMLIKNILMAAGYGVKTAIDGLEALTTLRAQTFDLVVSDVEMPRMNGFDLTEKIRADRRLAQTPVVLVTALETPEDRERGIDVGANAYIVKSSFDQSNLLEIVERLI